MSFSLFTCRFLFPKVLRVTILEAEGLRNIAVLRKTDSYVSADLVTNSGMSSGRTSVKKVGEGDRVNQWVLRSK